MRGALTLSHTPNPLIRTQSGALTASLYLLQRRKKGGKEELNEIPSALETFRHFSFPHQLHISPAPSPAPSPATDDVGRGRGGEKAQNVPNYPLIKNKSAPIPPFPAHFRRLYRGATSPPSVKRTKSAKKRISPRT